jgi:hypothetical protein
LIILDKQQLIAEVKALLESEAHLADFRPEWLCRGPLYNRQKANRMVKSTKFMVDFKK